MAIDYGDARTGVAVSDVTATLAGEAWVMSETGLKTVVEKIISEAVSRGVSVIVIGYPKNMNGSVGPRAEKSEKLAGFLRARSAQIFARTSDTACIKGSSDSQGASDTTKGPRQLEDERSGSLEIILWDERLTTMSAHRILNETGKYGKKRKDTVDAVAASLILESYLASVKMK